jgi:hypothetical protein
VRALRRDPAYAGRDGLMLTSRSRSSPQIERLHSPAAVSMPPWLSRLACGWALIYAAYRAYYAFGGTIGMFGTPVSAELWRLVNAVGAAALLGAAAIAALVPRIGGRPLGRSSLIAFGWVAFVGCVMHAVIDSVIRALSLAGLHDMHLPFWESIDQRASDLQDLLWNEPWFFVEGVLWLAISLHLLRSPISRRRFLVTGIGAVVALTVAGLLSERGVIGRLVIL